MSHGRLHVGPQNPQYTIGHDYVQYKNVQYKIYNIKYENRKYIHI